MFKNNQLIFPTLIIAFIAMVALSSNVQAETKSSATTIHEVKKLYRDEAKGIKYYSNEKYELAYQRFENTAKQGLKESQYHLAIMYLKGQYVESSIENGMAWLGVATELEIEEWSTLYDKIFSKLSESQQNAIKLKVAQFRENYGMTTQNISCQKKSKLGSRKKVLYCDKKTADAQWTEV